MVSLKSLHHNIGPDIDPVCPTSNCLNDIVIESSWMGAIRRPCSIQAGRAKMLFAILCACGLFWHSALTKLWCYTNQSRFEGSLEFGVRSLALCCHCHPPMQTPLVCNFHGVLPNIKLLYTPMSSENTHYSTVRIQDSTRFIVEESIVLLMGPQILLNLKYVPVGLAMYFGESWVPK